ncbi:hypothetical protein F7888_07770 [Bacillus sp. PS06]|nr:hypothetical protein [Bacillus sp. PS06]
MKKHSIFPGIILIGIGTYFLLQQLSITLFTGFFSWSTLVMIIGIALLVQAYSANDHSQILPGVILTGFGFHFHPMNTLSIWPDHFGMLVFIVALGFILRSLKTKVEYSQGFILMAFALLLLNYDAFINQLGALGSGLSLITRFWPVILIGIGFYLLFIKKK